MEEEDHLNADQIINNLSTTNMDLEEQIKILKMDVQDLEQLRQMDEEIIEMQKETERELQQKNQELLAAMATMTRQVTDLESRLEGQMNAEEIIAKLTSQNLDLEEQNKELKLDVHELEQLHQMDEEIIDAQKDTEKELQLRNEEQMMAMATLKRQLLDWESRAVDYERAIVKFRQKTGDLNETVQQLRDDLATMRAREEEKARAAGAEISLIASANRAFAEVVEAELNSCELQFARQQCVYLRAFLPDNFTKAGGDNDCLVLCVLFPRLSAKALALAQLLQQKFPQPPDGLRREHVTLSHRGEQWAHVRHFGYQLHQLHTTVHKFIAVFKNCSAERLSRLAVQQVEAGQREAKLEEYFKLLQQNRFDENTSIDQLVQIIKYFQRIFSTNLSTEQFNAREDLRNTLVQIREGLGWIKFNGQRLRHYLIADSITSSSSSSGGPNTGGSTSQQASPAEALAVSMHSSLMAKSMTGSLGGAGDAEFCAFLDRLGQLLTECEGMAMRALNRIPEENELILTPELSERLLSAIGALEKCGRIVHQSCSLATSQLSAVDSEGLPAQQMLEFVLSSVEKFVGQVDGQRRAHAHIFESLESIKSALDGLSEALENSSMEIPPPPNQQKCTAAATPSSGGLQHQQIGNGGCAGGIAFPPLLDRSHQRKQDAVETEALRWQVSKKDEELLRLQKALKLREQDIGTIKLRLSMAEKQLAENTAGAEIAQLKQNCEQLREEMKSQKEKYELQLDDMQAQLAVSRAECEKEKERTREFSKKALLANMSNRMQQQQQQQQQMASASISSPAPANAADFFPLMTSSPLLPLVTAAGNEGVETTMAAANVANGNVAMTSGGGGGAGDMQRVMGELRSAQERIHLLESQQLSPSLNSYSSTLAAAVGCPKCADRDRSEQQELKELLAESERLVHDSNLLLTPTVQQPIAAWVRHRKAKEQLNFRKESLQIRVHRFWKKYRADQPMPPMFSHLGQ